MVRIFKKVGGRALLVVFFSAFLTMAPAAYGLTIIEVARDLACPCECPLVLEDCNMSCGLRWKEEVGGFIAEGKTKDEIVALFVGKYGEAARLTTLQRINGKIYQYTRGFDTSDWVVLSAAAGFWAVVFFGGLYVGTNKLMHRKNGLRSGEN